MRLATRSAAAPLSFVRSMSSSAPRVHGDETTVPVLAKHQCRKGRLWTYVRDDKPFAGPAPPAAVFFYSRDRAAEHPERHLAGCAGILQADAYAGFNRLYDADRKPEPIKEASCWAHDCCLLGRAPQWDHGAACPLLGIA